MTNSSSKEAQTPRVNRSKFIVFDKGFFCLTPVVYNHRVIGCSPSLAIRHTSGLMVADTVNSLFAAIVPNSIFLPVGFANPISQLAEDHHNLHKLNAILDHKLDEHLLMIKDSFIHSEMRALSFLIS